LYPLIQKLAGRVTDTFVTRDGTRVHGEYFTHLFYFQTWLKKFQVVQEEYDRIRVFMVLDERGGDRSRDRCVHALSDIRNKIRFVMGEDCQIEFEAVEEIRLSPSGKHRYTLSHVASKYFEGEYGVPC
jgi:phenylacetate-CoA ligase